MIHTLCTIRSRNQRTDQGSLDPGSVCTNLLACCLVHQAVEVTSEVARTRLVGFQGPHECRAGWMDRLIVGDALSRSNGPARCADETVSRQQGHSWCPMRLRHMAGI